MAEAPVNGVGTTLNGAILSGATSLTLTSATGFTNAQYHCLITDGSNYELVLATALSGTTLTITRAVESYNGVQTAFGFASGSSITVVQSVASVVGLIEGQPYLTVTGLTGATQATRYVGSTTNGAPTSGTFAVGDFIVDHTATIWVCTGAGTPGTWSPSESQDVVLRSATATAVLGEVTIFTGSTASQTITMPANPVSGSSYIIVNSSSVVVQLAGGTNSISINGTIASPVNIPVNTAYEFIWYTGGTWYCTVTTDVTKNGGVLSVANGGTGSSTGALTLLGDVTGTAQASTVAKLQGVAVSTVAPSSSNVLQYNGTSWAPNNVPTSFQTSLSGLTPSTASTGAITLAGTLGVLSGGTGQTTVGTAGQALVVNSGATALEYRTMAVGTPATATQAAATLTAASPNIVSGSLFQLPTSDLAVGSRFKFTIGITKTGAGTATWGLAVKYGTAGTTSDAAIASWTSGTNTAAIDSAILEITVNILTTGASGTANCLAFYQNVLTSTTGLGSIAGVPGSTATLNTTSTTPYLHVDITPGSSAVMTAWCAAERLA